MLLNLTQAAAPTTHVISSQPKGILNQWGKQTGAYFASVRGFRYLTNADALAHTNATEIFDLASARQHLDNDALTYGATYYYRIGVVTIFDNLSVLSAVKSAVYMQIQSSEIASVDAAKLTSGTIPEARIATLAATKLTGTIAEARLSTLDAAKLTGTIDLNRFPSTAKPIEIFATVAAAGTATPEGRVIFVQADDKLYRATGSGWTAATDGADIVTNTFTGGKIIAGTITSTQLAADSVTARELVVTDWTNLFVNPQFAGGSTDGWRVTNANTMVAVAKAGSVAPISTIPNAYAVQMGSIASSSDAIGLDWIPVREGDEFFYEFDYAASSDATGTFQAIMRSKTAAGVEAPIGLGTLTLSTTWQTFAGNYTVPAGVVQIYAGMRSGGGGVGSMLGTNFRFNRRANGELLVDGSVTANKIVAGSITAAKIGAGEVSASKLAVGAISDNLLLDADFESATLDLWTGSGGTRTIDTTAAPPSGKNALKLDRGVTNNTVSMNGVYRDAIAVEEGDNYFFEYTIKASSASPNGAYFRVLLYTAAMLAASPASTDIYNNGAMTTSFVPKNGIFLIPAGVRYIKIQLIHHSSSIAQSLWVSSVMVKKLIKGELIVNGTIHGDKMIAGSITADKIDVTNLVVGTLNLAGESVSPSKFAARDFTSQIVDTEMSDFNCWYWYDGSMANPTRPNAKAANVYGIGSSRYLMYFNKAGIVTAYTVQYASTMADISVEAGVSYVFSVGVGEGVGGAPASPATAYDMLIDWYTVDSAGVPNSLISTTTVSLATAATVFAQYTTTQTSPVGAQVCRMRIKATRSTAATFWSTIIGSPAIRRRITRVLIEPNTINETFFAADNITQTMTANVNKTMVAVTCDHGSACNLVDIVASFRNNSGIVKTMDVQITNAYGVVIEEWIGFNLGDGATVTFSTSDINPIGTSTGYWLRANYTSTGAAIRAHIRATARRR